VVKFSYFSLINQGLHRNFPGDAVFSLTSRIALSKRVPQMLLSAHDELLATFLGSKVSTNLGAIQMLENSTSMSNAFGTDSKQTFPIPMRVTRP
jgi:hypothetical protein